jgi:two-component system chemotaxis response regulator CheY
MTEGRKSILIVDNDYNTRVSMKEVLEDEYEILEAIDGEDGAEKYKEYSPDLVLMDLLMPNVHGIGGIKRILDLDPHAKIIIVTGYDNQRLLGDAVKDGVISYIIKPFDKEKLTTEIEKVLE